MALETQISEETTNTVLNDIVEVATEATKEELDNTVDPKLYAAAREFQTAYMEYEEWAKDVRSIYSNYNQACKNLKNAMKPEYPDPDLVEQRKREKNLALDQLGEVRKQLHLSEQIKEEGTKIVQAQLNFQQQLNNILDQKMRTVFITDVKETNGEYSGGRIFYFDTEEIAQYLNYHWNKNEGNIRASYTNLTSLQMQEHLHAIEVISPKRYDSEDMEHLRWTRYSAEWRWRRALDQGVIYSGTKVKAALMWHKTPESSEWHILWVEGESTITEAYAAVVLKDEEEKFHFNVIESLLNEFEPYLLDVDNAPGVIMGDTANDIEGVHIEMAIKALDGQVLGLSQFYTEYAIPIIMGTNNFNKQKLKATYDKIKNDVSEGRIGKKVIEGTIKGIADDKLQNLINDINNANGRY